MVARALITTVKDQDGGITLTLDLLAGETRDGLELVQQYGMSSSPLPGSQCVTLFLGGSRDSGVVIATKGMTPETVFTLKPGEVALHTAEGDSVHLKNGRVIAITTETLEITASTAVRITSPKITTTGDMTATGSMKAAEVSDTVGKLSAFRTKYNGHTHVSAVAGSPTSTPTPTDP